MHRIAALCLFPFSMSSLHAAADSIDFGLPLTGGQNIPLNSTRLDASKNGDPFIDTSLPDANWYVDDSRDRFFPLMADNAFTTSELENVRQGFKTFAALMTSNEKKSEIGNCIARRAATWTVFDGNAMRPRRSDEYAYQVFNKLVEFVDEKKYSGVRYPTFGLIVKRMTGGISENMVYRGKAPVSFTVLSTPFNVPGIPAPVQMRYGLMGLTSNLVSPTGKYPNNKERVEHIVGTIGHELMHNLGFGHASYNSNELVPSLNICLIEAMRGGFG